MKTREVVLWRWRLWAKLPLLAWLLVIAATAVSFLRLETIARGIESERLERSQALEQTARVICKGQRLTIDNQILSNGDRLRSNRAARGIPLLADPKTRLLVRGTTEKLKQRNRDLRAQRVRLGSCRVLASKP